MNTYDTIIESYDLQKRYVITSNILGGEKSVSSYDAEIEQDSITALRSLVPLGGIVRRRQNFDDFIIKVGGKWLIELFQDPPLSLYELVIDATEDIMTASIEFNTYNFQTFFDRSSYSDYFTFLQTCFSSVICSYWFRYVITYDSGGNPIYGNISFLHFSSGMVVVICDTNTAHIGFGQALLNNRWQFNGGINTYSAFSPSLAENFFKSCFGAWDLYESRYYASYYGFEYGGIPYVLSSVDTFTDFHYKGIQAGINTVVIPEPVKSGFVGLRGNF